jgi:acetylornithine deacetylase/succinyl-diaminopimelate desuccinylase-like protein
LLAALLFATPSAATSTAEVAEQVRNYRQQNQQQIVDDFVSLLSIPNVATDVPNIRRNAEHIMALLRPLGVETRLLESPGSPPAVYGELLQEDADTTVMIYVHYDGQPVQAENWASDPWRPVLRDKLVEDGGREMPLKAPFDPESRLFARSAGDDKAPVIALVHALRALAESGLQPSVNLKLFFEGEEEAGSPHLQAMLETHKEILAADLWVFCDGPMHQTRRLQLAYGVRGAIGFDLTVYGPARPLHSGHYGNWAPNPISELSNLLASMRGPDGEVLIEGFSSQVPEPSAAELAAIDRIPRVDIALREELALGRTEGGERVEKRILKPALNFRGFQAGGVGAKSRNIIVPDARASVGIRMVPDQTIEHLQTVIEAHIRNQGYHLTREEPSLEERGRHSRVAMIRWGEHGYPAYRTAIDQPHAAALARVLNRLSGGDLIQSPTMGGSLPLYLIDEVLNVPVVILPIANHDNNQHGKDENLRLQNLWDGMELYAALLIGLAAELDANH